MYAVPMAADNTLSSAKTCFGLAGTSVVFFMMYGLTTYTSLEGVSSTQRPIVSACHFSMRSATCTLTCPSSSRRGSSASAFGWLRSMLLARLPKREKTAAAVEDAVAPPVVPSWLTTRSNTEPFAPLFTLT